jgi:selenocysteine lyase/cysteine desulfurase
MNEAIRSLFPVTQKYVYLNHAAVSPLSTRVREAMTRLVDDVTLNGAANYADWLATYERTRAATARLVGAQSSEIAFMRNTSDAISAVANGLRWRAGDNVVTTAVEFPANVYPWVRVAEKHNVTIKKAAERDGRIDTEELLSLIDERTRVVTISWVQFASGFRSDIQRIGRFCRERGVLFFIDAIQALGGLQLDVERDAVDAFAADAHKYLLGPEGVAVLYISERMLDQVEPTVVGWTSVKGFEEFAHAALDYKFDYRDGTPRFECGTLNTAGVYGLGAAVDLFLEVGPEAIEAHLLGLSDSLAERLSDKGYNVISSRHAGETSGIVCCTHPRHTPSSLYHSLLKQNIVTTPRLGRLRLSAHFYNTRDDIDALIAALPE